ncbi:MAG: biotin/lipoyl-containing protein [Candidatus Hydrothermales bacterium]
MAKKEGEYIKKNEPIVEIETQKVTVEIPSPYEGILYKILEKEGSVVEVGKPIAILVKEGEKVEEETKLTSPKESFEIIEKEEIKAQKVETRLKDKVLASPSARKLAREYGIDISKISPEKRIIRKKDVLRIIKKLKRKKEF